MSAEELTQQYLQQINTMQLATSVHDVSWACTVHFYVDADFNFYWMSLPTREHSKNIAKNPNVSAAVLVHENTRAEDYVIGISIAGKAELLSEHPKSSIGEAYIRKLHKSPSLLTDVASPHRFYRLTPSRIVLFDSKNFLKNPRQAVRL